MSKKYIAIIAVAVIIVVVGAGWYWQGMPEAPVTILDGQEENQDQPVLKEKDWELTKGNPDDYCTGVVYRGEKEITGWYEWGTNYVDSEWMFRPSDVVIEQDILPYNPSRFYWDLRDADPDLEERLKHASKDNPMSVVIRELSIYCEGAPLMFINPTN